MKRVNCLYRVSSKQQLHGDDIPVQREECMAYLGEHTDWEFNREYVEKAVSGFKTSVKDRDILQEILTDAREKTFDVLLVFMSDRIGRKEDESPAFVTTLNDLGIEVWSVKEGQLKTAEHKVSVNSLFTIPNPQHFISKPFNKFVDSYFLLFHGV